jgi:WD40 repeat protein
VAVTGDGQAVSGSGDQTLRVWDLGTGLCTHTLRGHAGGVNAVALRSDSRAVSASHDGTLRVWDLATGHCLAIFPCEAPVRSVALTSGQPPMIVAGLADGQVQFFSLENT